MTVFKFLIFTIFYIYAFKSLRRYQGALFQSELLRSSSLGLKWSKILHSPEGGRLQLADENYFPNGVR